MTVENTQNKMPPLQMGTTNEYPFTFAVLLQDPTEEEALEAIKASVLQADGTEIELVYNTDYTVTLNTDRIGGTLTVNDIRTSSDYITIYRQYAQTQEVDYKDFNSAPAETFEQCFDKLTMLSQQQQEEINRSIKLPVSSEITDLSLPNPIAGRTLKWNESETGLINSDVSIDEIDEFVKSANESAEIAVEKAEEIANLIGDAEEVAERIEKIDILTTLEIGDIGFTQMAIDESKGKRRVLNGQLIIQEQYIQFTNIIKNSVALNPSLACTEEEWQTAVTMSAYGLCDKFVIDDEAGTIRLPKYPNYFIGGVDVPTGNIPVVGTGMTLGLTNGTKNLGLWAWSGEHIQASVDSYGKTLPSTGSNNIGTGNLGVTTDATKSGIIAKLSNDQTEQIKGTYFIQVATGAETEDNITNTIELNNPFSLLDYKYSEYELNNLSWLRSNGQYNSKAIYPAVYDLLLKIYNGTETKAGVSVKLSTETFTDYDFVLNTADETFMLPTKVKLASGKAVVGNGSNFTLMNTSNQNNGDMLLFTTGGSLTYLTAESTIGYPASNTSFPVGVTTDPTKSGLELSDSDLYLYFYVGETVQNANLINAGRIEEKLTDLIPNNSALIANFGLPSEEYIDITIGATKATYTMPADGYLAFYGSAPNTSEGGSAGMKNLTLGNFAVDSLNIWGRRTACIMPVRKNDQVEINFSNATSIRLYPLQGNKGEL